jgi:hypothetical protein
MGFKSTKFCFRESSFYWNLESVMPTIFQNKYERFLRSGNDLNLNVFLMSTLTLRK